MNGIMQHVPTLTPLLTVMIGSFLLWLRLRAKDSAETEKTRAEAIATDAEVGRQLREELRGEIAALRDELERQDEECRRRLKAMEDAQRLMRASLEDARRVITRNGKVIAEQAATIEKLEAEVAQLRPQLPRAEARS